MNTYIQNLAMLSAVIAFGCNSNKPGQKNENKLEVETVLAQPDVALRPIIKSISGTVKNIFHGKDGYIASIHTAENLTYFATVSRSNLNEPHQYREFHINETVSLQGDYWKIDDEDQITVREIFKA